MRMARRKAQAVDYLRFAEADHFDLVRPEGPEFAAVVQQLTQILAEDAFTFPVPGLRREVSGDLGGLGLEPA